MPVLLKVQFNSNKRTSLLNANKQQTVNTRVWNLPSVTMGLYSFEFLK